jgi:Glycine-rich domain-containing protein-like
MIPRYHKEQKPAIDEIHVTEKTEVKSAKDCSELVEIVLDDRLWFQNFVAAVGLDHINYEKCQIGYQKYLYLLAKYQYRMEWVGFSPNPSIDLIWHCHLANPKHYFYDISFLMCGNAPHHKLLPGKDISHLCVSCV